MMNRPTVRNDVTAKTTPTEERVRSQRRQMIGSRMGEHYRTTWRVTCSSRVRMRWRPRELQKRNKKLKHVTHTSQQQSRQERDKSIMKGPNK